VKSEKFKSMVKIFIFYISALEKSYNSLKQNINKNISLNIRFGRNLIKDHAIHVIGIEN